jgi:alkylation response protein AidB-like acyl-CoA dehydrogenase
MSERVQQPGLTIAREFHRQIADAADEIDAQRRLPDALVSALKGAHVFRCLIPESVGGLALELPDFLDMVQEFAQADASTAWCVTQGAVIATVSVWLEPDIAREIWNDPDTATANGPPLNCLATPDGDDYRLTGRWGFSSGCQHANWMIGTTPVADSRRWVMAFFEKEKAAFHDNWQVQGLRGTGSFEFSVQNLVVKRPWTIDMSLPPNHEGDLHKIPTGLTFAVSFASVALGVARAGLDVVLALAADKVPGWTRQVLKDDPLVHTQVAHAEIRWRAAHAFLHATVNEIWNALPNQSSITEDQRIALRMAGTHVIGEAAAVLDIGYTVAGSSGIYHDNPLHRRFQDMHVITQHVQGRPSHYGFVGRYLLGHPYQHGPLA